MTFNFEASKREHLAHLVSMAMTPGAKDHAWWRAKEMAREYPEFYGDVPEILIAKVRKATEKPA